jgi:tRNA pseudouridine38-40 synthase
VIRLDLAYDGTDFHGWARQPGLRTVQGVVEEALRPMRRGEPLDLAVAGRTDAGVHASGQVASFDAPAWLEPSTVQRALNAMLAPEVVVLAARHAPEGFHARHSATGRSYLYRIDTGPLPDPFRARYVWHRPGMLAISPMRSAARELVGEHDFRSFCRAPEPPASTVRELRKLTVRSLHDTLDIRLEANGFLHQMVRSIVGTLVAVGEGRIDPATMPTVLSARTRAAAGPVAPPHGLTLVSVRYGSPRGGAEL